MHIHRLLALVTIAVITTGCTGAFGATEDSAGGPFNAPGLPRMTGQVAACAGTHEKTFTLEARETRVD